MRFIAVKNKYHEIDCMCSDGAEDKYCTCMDRVDNTVSTEDLEREAINKRMFDEWLKGE